VDSSGHILRNSRSDVKIQKALSHFILLVAAVHSNAYNSGAPETVEPLGILKFEFRRRIIDNS
jgi:hypothetical protein